MAENFEELLAYAWYYKIEVKPGLFTPGRDRPNLALIRKLLRNVDVGGKDCLDLGTMETVIPILLKRGGGKIGNSL